MLSRSVCAIARGLQGLAAYSLGVYVFGNGGCEGDGAGARQHLL